MRALYTAEDRTRDATRRRPRGPWDKESTVLIPYN